MTGTCPVTCGATAVIPGDACQRNVKKKVAVAIVRLAERHAHAAKHQVALQLVVVL